MNFNDKIVVITGGAGGVGQTLVRLFAEAGARIMIADMDEAACRQVADEARALGAEADYLAGNLRHKEYCERLIEETVMQFGGIDILLNNAGIIPRGTIEETSDEMWFTAMDVNLNAVFFLCRAAIPHMKQRGGGAIVNTSSVWGTYPGPAHVAYCTSKGAVAALTKNLGRDCAPLGIRVNAVCPHEINTPIGIGVTAATTSSATCKELREQLKSETLTRNQLRSFQEVAQSSSDIILKNLQRAGNLIQSFKEVAVDQSSEHIRSFNVKDYIEEILTTAYPTLKKAGHEVMLDCPDQLRAHTYPSALYQILTNLLMNSVKHGFKGIEQGKIDIRVIKDSTRNNTLVLDYTDNGQGMTEEV